MLADENGKHAFATTFEEHEAQRRGGAGEGAAVTGRPPLGAATRILGVIGDPVTHSRSPAMHNAALEALGLDGVYVAFPVPRGRGIDAVRAMATLGIAGLNVTMPHKEDAAFACDVLSPAATALALGEHGRAGRRRACARRVHRR